jgi:serine protease
VIACGLVFAVGCGDDDDGGAFEPVAVISATPSEGPAPLRVTFDGSASKTSSSSREYQWDLGDGTFDDRETFEHTYTVPGYYTVTLAVRDADRNAGTDSVDISVAADRLLSISGTVTAVPNQFTDSDTNNPGAPDGPNDERADAQEIPRTPAIIGGFLAATPTGRPGDRFSSSADQADWYAIALEAGQTVQLAIADWVSADPSRIDFDLFVFDAASGSLFDASVGDGQFETVQVADAGSYLIEVRAISGFSNYTLSVGATPSAASARELRTSAALVPGEILFQRGPVSKALGVATEPLGLEVVAEGGSDVVLGRLAPATALKSGGSGAASPALGAWAEGFSDEQLDKLRTLYEVKRIRARADVDHAEPNYVLNPTLTPDDPRYPTQWHYPLIGLPQAWELSTGSSSIIVAVVDTGVFLAHSDLRGRLIDGYDFIQDPARALDGDGIDPNPDDPGDGFVLELSSFHGTHVAGTVGAETNNELGVAGVSWGAQIMPVRVIGQGGGTSFDVLEGVRYAAGLENTSGTLPPRRADVINLSLGGSPFSQFEQDVYTQVRNAGVIVISAAGNDAVSEPSYPASYEGVVSVSAVGPDKQRAPYSNFGMFVDVAAPGGNLELDLNGDGLPDGVLSTSVGFDAGERTSAVRFMEGTSMASPHMAGVAALMKSVYADLTPEELDALLQGGSITEDLGDEGRDDVYGYGLIDAVRALQEAARLAGGGDLPSLLTVSPSLLVFEPGVSELTLEVAQVGADPLTVRDISAIDEWIVEVTELDVDQAGLGTYRVAVDRTALPDGAYLSTLTFLASNGESSGVTVSMRVGAESGPGDTGLVFVALLDASRPDEIREIVDAGAGQGVYEYSFPELDAGIYFLAAGTDNDNDGEFCDEGEACGAYATFSLPDGIRLGTDDIIDRNFLIGYRPDILAAQAAGAPRPFERMRLRP